MSRISGTVKDIITIETDEGSIECPAEFDVEGEEYIAEPYSWGESRGTELELSAELVSAQFGGLALTRDMVAKIIGGSALARIEDSAASSYSEKFRNWCQ